MSPESARSMRKSCTGFCKRKYLIDWYRRVISLVIVFKCLPAATQSSNELPISPSKQHTLPLHIPNLSLPSGSVCETSCARTHVRFSQSF